MPKNEEKLHRLIATIKTKTECINHGCNVDTVSTITAEDTRDWLGLKYKFLSSIVELVLNDWSSDQKIHVLLHLLEDELSCLDAESDLKCFFNTDESTIDQLFDIVDKLHQPKNKPELVLTIDEIKKLPKKA